MEKRIERKKEEFTILGISIWRLFAYFIIYSVVGFVIETLFGLLTKGLLESRKSFLYGPFCSIYGVGAVSMILFLQYFKKNNFTLFGGGFLIGSIIEYLISFIGQAIFRIRWWDYSEKAFNLNGRICVYFSLFWGVLAIFLITYFNPKVDKFIDKMKNRFKIKNLKKVVAIGIILLFLDFLITCLALDIFFARLVNENNLEIANKEVYIEKYNKLNEKTVLKSITDKIFSNEKVLKSFPNLKTIGKNGEIIYIDSILPEITPYYVKVFTPKK